MAFSLAKGGLRLDVEAYDLSGPQFFGGKAESGGVSDDMYLSSEADEGESIDFLLADAGGQGTCVVRQGAVAHQSAEIG